MINQDLYDRNLEDILRANNFKRILSVTEVMKYTGKSRDYVRDHLKISGDGTTAVHLATILAKM